MNTSHFTLFVYGYDWSFIRFIYFFYVDVSVFLCFSSLCRNLSISSFLVFKSIFTSDTSPLQPYYHQSSWFTLLFYLKNSFSRDTFLLTHLLYGYTLYCDGCFLNIGFLISILTARFLFSYSARRHVLHSL